MRVAILIIPAIHPSQVLAFRHEPLELGNEDRCKAGPRAALSLITPLGKPMGLVTSSQTTNGLHKREHCLSGCQKYLASSEF